MVKQLLHGLRRLCMEFTLFKLEDSDATHYDRLATYVTLLYRLRLRSVDRTRLRTLQVESTIADVMVLIDLVASMRRSLEEDGVLNYVQTGIAPKVGVASAHQWLVDSTHRRGMSVDDFFSKYTASLEALLLELKTLVDAQPHYVERKLSPLESGTRSLVELLLSL